MIAIGNKIANNYWEHKFKDEKLRPNEINSDANSFTNFT